MSQVRLQIRLDFQFPARPKKTNRHYPSVDVRRVHKNSNLVRMWALWRPWWPWRRRKFAIMATQVWPQALGMRRGFWVTQLLFSCHSRWCRNAVFRTNGLFKRNYIVTAAPRAAAERALFALLLLLSRGRRVALPAPCTRVTWELPLPPPLAVNWLPSRRRGPRNRVLIPTSGLN